MLSEVDVTVCQQSFFRVTAARDSTSQLDISPYLQLLANEKQNQMLGSIASHRKGEADRVAGVSKISLKQVSNNFFLKTLLTWFVTSTINLLVKPILSRI